MSNKLTIDRDRGAVYLAEDQVERILASRSRAVRLDREVVILAPRLIFGDLDAVAAFVTGALAHPATLARYPGAGPVAVTARRGFRRATYVGGRPDGGPAQIQIPARDSRGSWAMAQTVVLHELAHHLAAAPGHGRPFRAALEHLYEIHLGQACARLLRTLFAPLADLPVIAHDADDPALRRVGALLAKATATDSADEAAAYLAKANILAARHSVDMAVAALRAPDVASEPTHRMVTIGRPGEQMNRLLVALFARLAHGLGVTVDVGPRSTYVLAYGLAGDLDRLEAVYATASTVMVEGADAHARSQEWRGERYAAIDDSGRQTSRPVTSRVARNAFCIGFVEQVTRTRGTGPTAANHVSEAEIGPPAQAGAAPGAGTPTGPGPTSKSAAEAETVALALRRKELIVSQYHQRATRARGRWRGSASSAGSATQSRRAGQAAGARFGQSQLTGRGRPQLGS
jgi:putative metallohydrolase (TIGR04338 family)